MGLSLRRRKEEEIREDPNVSIQDWVDMFNYAGSSYSVFGGSSSTTYTGAHQEEIGQDFRSKSALAYKSNGVVFACMGVRMRLFSEARFQFRERRNGRPGDLFGTQALAPLETPWPGGTTGDLLARALLHADLAGNAFLARSKPGITPLRPDWTYIIGGVDGNLDASVWHPDAEVLGYAYQEGGKAGGNDPVFYLPGEVAHFAPNPDPDARWRGMSWLTPVIREVMADKAMTDHKLKFLEQGATPNLLVKLDVPDLETFERWIEKFKLQHEGARNAYKTMFMAAGADATVIGTNMQQLDFKVTQGAGETRVAAAAGVPPVIVGLSEGLAAATYSNYGQARRAFADGTMRPLWRNISASLQQIVPAPTSRNGTAIASELWYDDRDIAALHEDQKDLADIQQTKAQSMLTLINSGYDPDSVTKAIASDDLTLLRHTGLVSVQLQPPGTTLNGPQPALPAAKAQPAIPAKT